MLVAAALATSVLPAAERTVAVMASGEAQAKPEKAVVNFYFTGFGWTAAKAQTKADENIAGFMKKISENKVAVSSSTVGEIKLKPSYQFNRDLKTQVASDFLVSRKVSLELADAQAVARLMDASLSIGSFSLESAVLTVNDKKSLKQQAFANALEEGNRHAETLAKSLGGKIGPVVSMEELSSEVQDMNLIEETGPGLVKAAAKIRIVFNLQ